MSRRTGKACLTIIYLCLGAFLSATPARAEGPSFDCAKVEAGSIEETICKDKELSELDRKLGEVYGEATKKAVDEHPPVLKAEQRGWVKGRDDCWKEEDVRKCVEQSYVLRIAELQAQYRLVASEGPVYYYCDDDVKNEVVLTFFKTDPPTLTGERGDSTSLMYLKPSGSGSKYEGNNESVWIKRDEALIVWGYGSPEMKCKKKP